MSAASALSQITGYTLKDAVVAIKNWWQNAPEVDKDAVIASLTKTVSTVIDKNTQLEDQIQKKDLAYAELKKQFEQQSSKAKQEEIG